ncbi:glycosyltransferase [Hymenobacter jejuensis]|uniref:Glycosyltransferase family 2 protein n=1 Tax=Hymenobacter jejuensis TaxID=2502781 RepID=A0A5B7ZWW9_9BACT|nr:glycosyltransferase [Hymenobacter jejuensis]QDA59347.1 glycosyltransferase family 2 protein [Hymenobacter jejuensis]
MSKIFAQGFSIVLCTHNGQSRLSPTLAHLAKLQIPIGHNIELLVVNNGSTDQTESFTYTIWTALGAPFPLRLLAEPRTGKGYAVERGYDAALYSYILTVDDDNWLQADYLMEAASLLERHPDVGILQGKSIGAFETELPEWAHGLEVFFVLGSPIPETGYFPANDYHVWGAGMVIRTADWVQLRRLGFAFLTSKVPGKAAGEDHETAIALLLLGRKIYYSDKLQYQHFMPAKRITKENLKKNFNLWSYIMHYYFLYSIIIDSNKKSYRVTRAVLFRRILKRILGMISDYTLKQHLSYWVRPNQEFYQLRLYRDYNYCKWVIRLWGESLKDAIFLQSWMKNVIREEPVKFMMSDNPT